MEAAVNISTFSPACQVSLQELHHLREAARLGHEASRQKHRTCNQHGECKMQLDLMAVTQTARALREGRVSVEDSGGEEDCQDSHPR